MEKIEEKIADKLSKMILNQSDYSHEDSLKIRYGLSILIVNIAKALALYLVAILIGSFIPTLVAHVSYCILRHFNFGFHFESSTACTLFGIIVFPIATKFISLSSATPNIYFHTTICLLLLSLTAIYAPSYTSSLTNRSQWAKRKTIIVTLLLLTISFFTLHCAVYILWGALISLLLVVLNVIQLKNGGKKIDRT